MAITDLNTLWTTYQDKLSKIEEELKEVEEKIKFKDTSSELASWREWDEYVKAEEYIHDVDALAESSAGGFGIEKDHKNEMAKTYDYGFADVVEDEVWKKKLYEVFKVDEPVLVGKIPPAKEIPVGGFSIEAKAAPKEEKQKRVRYPSYKKDDRVNTPNGPGSVYKVDRDGTVCVEIDSDLGILYEFEKKEIKKIK